MKKYFPLIKFEWKTIVRDPFQLFLLAFPFLLLLFAIYLFPLIIGPATTAVSAAHNILTLILLVMLLAMGTYFVGAMGTFLLLEQKDEKTMNTIAVTPIGMSGYLSFKMIYLYMLAVMSILIVLLGTKLFAADRYTISGASMLDAIGIWHILTFALVSGLFAPALALMQGALAKNKVEGFALMKGTGITAMVPLLALLNAFSGKLQYVLGIFPNYWSIKAMMLQLYPSTNAANLNYWVYMGIGAVYSLVIMVICYRLYMKKIQY